MGRPPCCDKNGVKKGPWAPEEDIMLVSYVQEHGPGNWRAVPNITGLSRCSKSCRLRWTNYLRPGIKRGSFSDHEEKMIVQLQALLGNKWAAIASYLPDRTDNDIKNYWNTHLKKKLKRIKNDDESSSAAAPSFSRGQWERRLQTDIKTAKQALEDALSSETHITQLFKSPATAVPTTSCYASSTENISRLLKQWEKKESKPQDSGCSSTQNSSNNPTAAMDSSCSEETPITKIKSEKAATVEEKLDCCVIIHQPSDIPRSNGSPVDIKPDPAPLSMLESWFFEDQGKDYFSLDGNSGLF